jgi:hypothetical protein
VYHVVTVIRDQYFLVLGAGSTQVTSTVTIDTKQVPAMLALCAPPALHVAQMGAVLKEFLGKSLSLSDCQSALRKVDWACQAQTRLELLIAGSCQGDSLKDVRERLQPVVAANVRCVERVFDHIVASSRAALELICTGLVNKNGSAKLNVLAKIIEDSDLNKESDTAKLLEVSNSAETAELYREYKVWLGAKPMPEKILSYLPGKVIVHASFEGVAKSFAEALQLQKTTYQQQVEVVKPTLANLMAVQALFRTLEPGESREALARKCSKSFETKDVVGHCDARLSMLIAKCAPKAKAASAAGSDAASVASLP